MSSQAATSPQASDDAQDTSRSAARRVRFRESVTGLASRAQSTDLIRWIVLPAAISIIAGLNFILFGWIGAARTFRQIEQIPYLISGGLFGLALVVLGGLLLASTFWMMVAKKLQDEAEERHRLLAESLAERLAEALAHAAPSANGAEMPAASRRSRAAPAKARSTSTARSAKRS